LSGLLQKMLSYQNYSKCSYLEMESVGLSGRSEILSWINSFLALNYVKIEDLSNGAAHCQLMDAIHPGKVPLPRVDFNAKSEYDIMQNYKILQVLFQKLKIDKEIPVQLLMKGKYQGNFEFAQWMKRYFDSHYVNTTPSYDPVTRRKECKTEYIGDKINKKSQIINQSKDNKENLSLFNNDLLFDKKNPTLPFEKKSTEQQIAQLKELNADLRLTLDSTEKERDFYFRKLRDIEIFTDQLKTQNIVIPQVSKVIDAVQSILYATDESAQMLPESLIRSVLLN